MPRKRVLAADRGGDTLVVAVRVVQEQRPRAVADDRHHVAGRAARVREAQRGGVHAGLQRGWRALFAGDTTLVDTEVDRAPASEAVRLAIGGIGPHARKLPFGSEARRQDGALAVANKNGRVAKQRLAVWQATTMEQKDAATARPNASGRNVRGLCCRGRDEQGCSHDRRPHRLANLFRCVVGPHGLLYSHHH